MPLCVYFFFNLYAMPDAEAANNNTNGCNKTRRKGPIQSIVSFTRLTRACMCWLHRIAAANTRNPSWYCNVHIRAFLDDSEENEHEPFLYIYIEMQCHNLSAHGCEVNDYEQERKLSFLFLYMHYIGWRMQRRSSCRTWNSRGVLIALIWL